MDQRARPSVTGRGSQLDPPNRFEAARHEIDLEQVEADDDYLESLGKRATEYLPDRSRVVVSENRSPDVPFTYSVNPYRGCAHGCSYCYARPSHEYLGFGAGADFERRLVIKPRAGELLREAFEKPSWKGDLLVFSGITDCYQPIEARYELTRRCLEVCRDYQNPVHIITKSTLVERDLDVLAELHARASATVSVSVTFWDAEVARIIEPYVPAPRRRIEPVRRLSAAGIPGG